MIMRLIHSTRASNLWHAQAHLPLQSVYLDLSITAKSFSKSFSISRSEESGFGDELLLEDARRVLFGVEPHLESLAVIECGFGRGLMSDIGAVGAGRVCGAVNWRCNPD